MSTACQWAKKEEEIRWGMEEKEGEKEERIGVRVGIDWRSVRKWDRF